MNDRVNDVSGETPKVRRLSDAVRKVRIAEAERVDAFADLFETEKARLNLLAEELDGVFAEVAPDDGYFIFKVASGTPPRLWIDPTTHLVIARDRRSYRMLKDTRLGRTVLFESADIPDVADVVTDYIAERVVEREKALEADFVQDRQRHASGLAGREEIRAVRRAAPVGVAGSVVLVLFGAALGVGALLVYAWFRMAG
ncbi:hypothetical protein [Methylobrevis pamukkalensis]|uniref:Uncharacterized protein n=1 Tax=Methylobrevis pamukkalensis TaxID=1439726 RepID=A0A1E3H1G5_9HYPH|nr:hypothetical protein [Methylobrevis pamukkalensis]ODN69636.1 hypothetical protein A6302_03056 [Methylobrevis pamukkalensis]